MEIDINQTYPGANATPQELICLANEFHRAADSLFIQVKQGAPLSRAPAYLCAIHATELFLNAFLLHMGNTPQHIRSHHHDLTQKWELAAHHKLVLKKKTIDHLAKLTDDREYLLSRYGPELVDNFSQITRLTATLNEISKKVISMVSNQAITEDKNAA
jgi:hypothetical protein